MSSDRDAQAPVYTGLITIWPEWTESDLSTEKWDVQTAGAGAKSAKDPKVKGASFEDPEGRTRMPHSLLRVLKDWKRPQELFGENLCVVRNTNRINLKEPNRHLMFSEFMRHYLSHVTLVWYLAERKKLTSKNQPPTPATAAVSPVVVLPSTGPTVKTSATSHKESKHNIGKEGAASASKTSQGGEAQPKALCFEDPMNDWAPWNLIYGGPLPASRTINAKGEPPIAHVPTNLPQYNPNGKYAVKLYWMGAWRKVLVDDYIPVDEKNQPLLPVCQETNELWPLILTKAVMKVVSLDFGGGLGCSEMSDSGFLLHVLTGYIPHIIYLGHPRSTRKAIWNKLQALLPLNKKPPPEDILAALAENWDIRTHSAFRAWTTQNDPAYLQKLDSIRASRLHTAALNIVSTNVVAPASAATLGASNTLAPKVLVRSASARNSSNAPRKLEISTPSTLTPPLSAQADAPRTRNPRTPEVLVYATYRSAHHDPGIFDKDEKSRSGNLYDNGFLRAESHPVLLRNIRDLQPKRAKRSPVPQYKLFRPLSVNVDRYSQILLRGRKTREHPVRSIDFVSLLWTEKGRLAHQTTSRAAGLVTGEMPEARDQIRWKPIDGYRPSLSAIPENCKDPRIKTASLPVEVSIKPLTPPSSLPYEEKVPSPKGKVNEPGKPLANQTAPEPTPPQPISSPPLSNEELQKHCQLNRGSIEFNRFYESLEIVYIFVKPETFDYQSAFSFYQSNVVTDGRPPSTKKKGGEQNPQSSVSGSENSRSAAVKPPSSQNQGKFGKTALDLPSPFLMVDNPYPTSIVLSISTVSRWFFAPRPEAKSQERMSVVAGAIEDFKGMERPLPLVVSMKPYDWVLPSVSDFPVLTVKVSAVQGVCYQVPAGRHIFRLKIVCPSRRDLEPHGIFIRTFSRDAVHIGPEDTILKMTAFDSYQYSILARRTLLPFLRWWRVNGIPTFSHPPHRELIAVLGLEEEAHNKGTRRVFFDAMLAALYSAMQIYLREFCNRKGAYTLRAFIGDLTTRNVLNLNKTQLAKKDSKSVMAVAASPAKLEVHTASRQAESGKKAKQKVLDSSVLSVTSRQASAVGSAVREAERDSARERALQAKKEKMISRKPVIGKNELKAMSFWNLYFIAAKATNVLQARKAGSKKKEAVRKTAQDMFDAILRNEQHFANCFFRNLCRNLPPEWLDMNFFYRQERRFISREITGTFPDFPPNTWKLFFRDTFFVQEPLFIAFRLTTNISPMRLSIVNNDTRQTIPAAFFQPLPYLFDKNENGYAISAEAKSGVMGWKGSPWSLRIVQALDPFKHESPQAESLLIRFNGTNPLTNFVTKELIDYFLPDLPSGSTIARISVTVKNQSLVTINFIVSNPEAHFQIQIFSSNECCLYKNFARGVVVIPAYQFRSSEPPLPETFTIVVTCLDDSWQLTGLEWKFAYTEKSKRMAVEYGRESPSTPPSTSPIRGEKQTSKKSNKGSRERDKDSDKDSLESCRSKGKDGKDKSTFDLTKPHWSAKFIVDTTDTEVQCTRDLSLDEAIKAELHHAVSSDASVLQRGKDFREDYLKKHASLHDFLPPDSAEYPGWVVGTQTTTWPQPVSRFNVFFDLAALHRSAAGDASDELDLYQHQLQIRRLAQQHSDAATAKEIHVQRERLERERRIQEQTEWLKTLVNEVVAERRRYIDQREVKKRQLGERALEEEKLLVLQVVAHDHPKADEKHKKAKK